VNLAGRRSGGVIAPLLVIAGGGLKIPLWILFISLHGPTSFNENGRFLGGDPLIWGAIMSAVPSLLIAAGLIAHARALWLPMARRAGLILVLGSLLLPAIVDLASRALWPPLLMPVLAAGALILGVSARVDPPLSRLTATGFLLIGVLLAATFAYALLIPMEVFDAIGGYRLQGIVEHVLVGLGWIAVGVGVLRGARAAQPEARAPIP
jgi:hypothetical protein